MLDLGLYGTPGIMKVLLSRIRWSSDSDPSNQADNAGVGVLVGLCETVDSRI